MRVRMTLEEKGLAWTSHHIDLRKAENATPEYFAIHPKGLVPALVHDGVVIIESTDIIDYLDERYPEPPLHPADRRSPKEDARMDASCGRQPHLRQGLYVCEPDRQAHGQIARRAREVPRATAERMSFETFMPRTHRPTEFRRNGSRPQPRYSRTVLPKLDATLAQHEWLAGDAFSLADITWVPLYVTLNNAGFPLARYPNVVRWKDAVRARPSFEKAVIDWVPKDLAPRLVSASASRSGSRAATANLRKLANAPARSSPAIARDVVGDETLAKRIVDDVAAIRIDEAQPLRRSFLAR